MRRSLANGFGPVVAMKGHLRWVQEALRREETKRVSIVNFTLKAIACGIM